MQIQLTETADKMLKEALMASPGKHIQLAYDSEGCGCAVSGVPALWLTDQPVGETESIQTNGAPILIQKVKKVFFDEQMKMDANEKSNTFSLKSNSETLNPRMRMISK
ncbi:MULTISPECIES: iron-sulfur cluster biosynthesis family protein [Bacillus]|uniref:Core domain-containing protein n=2 Tax=Bacillus TaxID=1386 RepID=A0A0M4G8H1_9BACI|nr:MULTISPECIES: iron-sulfur cluster biosynthesis family protein [Bacillus]ALC81495.1 hypothetical protein AM592_07705 [Bacillus gobiensis]MBP1080540.1 uncharacterized protein YqkB [Bacillus capparidis]MED1094396.1 iron-sulfur cluster biosynthesis family protein [Bacillus capparidis]